MAQYSQNVSEQVMKSDTLGAGLPWRLLVFSFFIFLLSILTYLGLNIGYANYLDSQIAAKQQEIDALDAKVSREARSVFVDFYSRLSNFRNLSADHVYTNKFFPMLEKITSPYVYYNNFDLNISEKRLVLSGLAANYESLSRQLYLYNNEPMIDAYILNQSRIVEGLVNFRVTLILSSKLFAK